MTDIEPGTAGRVLQVNVSPGGVPKRPVSEAWVGHLGLAGDRHHDDTVHGGPHRAVCLLAIEAIRRVAADGHPIRPGAVGENLTTEGIELALLPEGTRLAIGDKLVLEIASPAGPCDTIVDAFSDRRSGRISILRFPTDSRMYARTLVEGVVRPGDAIRVLPPVPESLAATHRLLDLLDSVEREAYRTLWDALGATGAEIHIVDDGELVVAACPALPGPPFNRGFGLRLLPDLVGRMTEVFVRAGSIGWLAAAEPPFDGAVASPDESVVLWAPVEATLRGAGSPGVTVRPIDAAEAATWADVQVAALGLSTGEAEAWRALAPYLASAPGETLILAEDGAGRAVGAAALFARRRVGFVVGAAVVPEARGRGIQGALIDARIRIAIEAGCTRTFATAMAGGASDRNLRRAGLTEVWTRRDWRFDPALDVAGAAAEAGTAVSRG